jgi:hypothetical protein
VRIAPASAAVTVTVTAVVAVAVTLGGCSRDAVSAAPHAADPACATALGKLPGALLGQARRASSVTGMAVFGDPTIVVRCGVTPLGPTTLRCLSVNDVDWVVDDRKDPLVFTTFGRSPAVEVRIPESYPVTGDSAALVDLQAVAQALPTTSRHCIG